MTQEKWLEWCEYMRKLEDRNARLVHTVNTMRPLIDSLAKYYFEPGPERGVCAFCDAGGGYYDPERHAHDCPAFVAWQVKPGADEAFAAIKPTPES